MQWFHSLARAKMCFCEEPLPTFPVHPADTWTNIAPFIAGCVILWQARRHEQSFRVLGIASIFTAICSAYFHATNTFLGEILDLGGMFAVIYSCLLIQIAHRNRVSQRLVLPWTIAITALTTIFSVYFIWAATPLFAFLVFGVFGLEIADDHVRAYRNGLMAAGTLVVAFLFWIADYRGWLCDPSNHVLTGHGVWHLLNGLVFYFAYRQLVTNRSKTAAINHT